MPDTAQPPAIVWLRDDLRIADNPALAAAAKSGGPVVCVYVLEDAEALRPIGGAARWWLHHSLTALRASLEALGVPLVLRRGDPRVVIPALAQECEAGQVFWNRRYAPGQVSIDSDIKTMLKDDGLSVESFNGNLIYEPWEIKSGSGEPYRVFSPFWKAALRSGEGAPIAETPKSMTPMDKSIDSNDLGDWKLLPTKPNWAREFPDHWNPGEQGAQARLKTFINHRLKGYKSRRDIPGVDATSALSPHLNFGEISPRQIRDAVKPHLEGPHAKDASKFMAEVGWREFSYLLLFYAEDLATVNWKRDFDDFPWVNDDALYHAWTKGQTGYPLVDAGMRQLWQSGWMHNRVRMVVASFLIKHLRNDWRRGEDWFWDCLVDADSAANPASWQWVAGSGADAAPYYRIFNPILQSERFDKNGEYIKTWVPELSKLPAKHLHAPWDAPQDVLKTAGVTLGKTYPKPIVDHPDARKAAMEAYNAIKKDPDA